MSTLQFYEQPVNERMRAFLRLEHLFAKIDFGAGAQDTWSNRAALLGLIELTTMLSRSEIKGELIKELDRHLQTLESLSADPRVDRERLTDIGQQLAGRLTALKKQDVAFGHELRSNELINAVRQRSAIPAGTCDFDIPALHFWLAQPAARRSHDLGRWLSHYGLVRAAVDLCMSLVRQSATFSHETATAGFFQMTLDGAQPCQLIRVAIPTDSTCFTEISAGKHRFTVRFMEQGAAEQRAKQAAHDVDFTLHCCTL